MQVIEVRGAAARNRFLDLPYRLYRDDPVWVAPLRSEIRKEFDPAKNPFIARCPHALFLLEKDGEAIGRIAAFVDPRAVDYWQVPIGHFGYFECPDDVGAAKMLFDAARAWLMGQGMTAMRGPWTFVSQEWGLVIDGYEPAPCVMAPYNPPYYARLFDACGLEKAKDLVVHEIDVAKGYRVPERILTVTDDVRRRTGVRVRNVDLSRYDEEVERVFRLANASIDGIWGFVPVTPEEIAGVARDLKPIIDARGVLFAEAPDGEAIGFAVAIPDVNVALKGLDGRLFPFGWMKLAWRMRKLNSWRMFALGVAPGWQRHAVDSLIYRALHDSLWTPTTRMEINYVIEDNHPMINAVAKLGATPLRRYRVYDAAL